MASQEDALAVAVEELTLAASLASLPLALLFIIFSLLPADQRMHCAEVCRGWRDALTEHSLWLRLDLSEASGGLARPATDVLLRAAAARAGGQLHALDVSECDGITHACLLSVLAANAGTMRELHACTSENGDVPGFADVQRMLRAAPQLRVFDAEVMCDSMADVQRLLRNEGAFAPLRLRRLQVDFDVQTEAAVLSFAEDLAAHSSVEELCLIHAPLNLPAALDAIVAAALANCLSDLLLVDCRLCPASAPALARLLGGGALRSLWVNNNAPLLEEAALGPLFDALPTWQHAPALASPRRSHRQRGVLARAAAAGGARQHVSDDPGDHGHGRGRGRCTRGAGDREQPRCSLSCRYAHARSRAVRVLRRCR
jgi:hypothetical protein